MNGLIEKQKVAKRNRHVNSNSDRRSLIEAASKYKAVHQSSRFDILKGRFRKNRNRRSVGVHIVKAHSSADSAGCTFKQKPSRRKNLKENIKTLSKNMLKQLGLLNPKIFVPAVSGVAVILLASVLVTGWVREQRLF